MGRVFIESVASSSDFGAFIEEKESFFGFGQDEFFDKMELFEESTLSSRFSKDWCETVIKGEAGEYWDKKRKYYPAILKLLEDYELNTIRFACDW